MQTRSNDVRVVSAHLIWLGLDEAGPGALPELVRSLVIVVAVTVLEYSAVALRLDVCVGKWRPRPK
jgi:hypothetical protein